MQYCESIFKTRRRPTREVMVGNIGVGGNNPIRIQSMTTSDTRDVTATVEQVIKLANIGCEIVRVTVQGMKEAQACEQIRNALIKRGYVTPLVADIHFYPPAAMTVVEFVDKVRINPGNYIDKRASFKVIEYDDASYQQEIDKIEEKFSPLVEKCKQLNKAMRIGTNHGSLSDRIMNRYGDTPQGMVESALEFARVCRKYDYHDFMFSMKASNPKVMITAYRLLVAEMYKLGWDYPLHLGVTEAGEGEDGRVKSAIGIGSLLLDGIGDTIRVSLTENPWEEINPCQRLKQLAQTYEQQAGVPPFIETHRKIDSFSKRKVSLAQAPFLHRDGSVILSVTAADIAQDDFITSCGKEVDAIIIEEPISDPHLLEKIQALDIGIISPHAITGALPLISLRQANKQHAAAKFSHFPEKFAVKVQYESSDQWNALLQLKPACIFLSPDDHHVHYARRFFEWAESNHMRIPVILSFAYPFNKEDTIIHAAAENGTLFCDGFGDGIHLKTSYGLAFEKSLAFNILQGVRMRTIKTEFISCPGCGRTLFELQDVAKKIRDRTSHLPGVKIAIMGCIVNGPGEMADADFGYVGSRPGKIDLYVGKKCVEKNIDFEEAPNRLVELIKMHDRWVEAS